MKTQLPRFAVIEIDRKEKHYGRISIEKFGNAAFIRIEEFVGRTGYFSMGTVTRIDELTRCEMEQIALPDSSPEGIKHFCAAYFNMPVADMECPARPNHIAHRRMIAMAICREYKFSLASIGSAFGNRDHGTVLHAKKRVSDLMATEPWVKYVVFEIRRLLSEARARLWTEELQPKQKAGPAQPNTGPALPNNKTEHSK